MPPRRKPASRYPQSTERSNDMAKNSKHPRKLRKCLKALKAFRRSDLGIATTRFSFTASSIDEVSKWTGAAFMVGYGAGWRYRVKPRNQDK